MAKLVRAEYVQLAKQSQDPLHRKHYATRTIVQADSGCLYDGIDDENLHREPDREQILDLLGKLGQLTALKDGLHQCPPWDTDYADLKASTERLEAELRELGYAGPSFRSTP